MRGQCISKPFRKIMNKLPEVLSINISKGGIPKRPIDSVLVSVNGLEGDGHDHEKHYRTQQAVCLQDMEMLEQLCDEGYPLYAGATGENLTVRNLNVNSLPLGTVLKFTGGIVLEIAKIRTPCYVLDAIHPQLKTDIVNRCGMYAQVLQEGRLKTGDTINIDRQSPTNLSTPRIMNSPV